jgi:hypothetical protein
MLIGWGVGVLVGVRVGLGVADGEGVLLGEGVVVEVEVGEGWDVEVLVTVGLAAKVGVPCAWLQPVMIITSAIHKVRLAAKRISF